MGRGRGPATSSATHFEPEFAPLFSGIPGSSMGGGRQGRPSTVSRYPASRLYGKLFAPGASSLRMAPRGASRNEPAARVGERKPCCRSGDGLANFPRCCGRSLHEADTDAHTFSGRQGCRVERSLSELCCDAPTDHAISGPSTERRSRQARLLARRCAPFRHSPCTAIRTDVEPRHRRGQERNRRTVEQRSGRRPNQPLENAQARHVRPRRRRVAAGENATNRIAVPPQKVTKTLVKCSATVGNHSE